MSFHLETRVLYAGAVDKEYVQFQADTVGAFDALPCVDYGLVIGYEHQENGYGEDLIFVVFQGHSVGSKFQGTYHYLLDDALISPDLLEVQAESLYAEAEKLYAKLSAKADKAAKQASA